MIKVPHTLRSDLLHQKVDLAHMLVLLLDASIAVTNEAKRVKLQHYIIMMTITLNYKKVKLNMPKGIHILSLMYGRVKHIWQYICIYFIGN